MNGFSIWKQYEKDIDWFYKFIFYKNLIEVVVVELYCLIDFLTEFQVQDEEN